jgi:hypothetical protein
MYEQLTATCRMLVSKIDFWFAVAAGLVYSSWPLGFWFNPLVAHRDFASELGAAHQPYMPA